MGFMRTFHRIQNATAEVIFIIFWAYVSMQKIAAMKFGFIQQKTTVWLAELPLKVNWSLLLILLV